MDEPLKGSMMSSLPKSATRSTKKPAYDHARTKKPETERIRSLRNRSKSPNGGGTASPNGSSRRSRSVAVENVIQNAKEKVQQHRRSNSSGNEITTPLSPNSSRRSRSIAVGAAMQNAKKKVQQQRMHNSSDTMMSSNHTSGSGISASALLDIRRPLQKGSEGTMALRPSATSKDPSAIDSILGISGSNTPQPILTTRTMRTAKARRSATRRNSNSASPLGRRESNQRRLPSIASVNDGQYNDIGSDDDEEEDYLNDRISRPRKHRRSKTADNRNDGAIDRNTQSLSPTRQINGRRLKKREARKPRVESVSSLSGSEGESRRRSARMMQQSSMEGQVDRESPINQSQRTNDAVRSFRQQSRALPPYAVRSESKKYQKSTNHGKHQNNNHLPPTPYHQSFQSPTAARGAVSPLSSPSNHDVPENISPLTTSTPTFLNGPIRMQIPWAKESDMGGAIKEPRNKVGGDNEGGAEAEDSFEMNIEPSLEFRQIMEVDRNPVRPDRLSSIRSLSWKERHTRNSYPHELERYKGKSPNSPDYMPKQPTRFRGSIATASLGKESLYENESTGSFSLAGSSSMGTSSKSFSMTGSSMGTSSKGRASMFENSYAHDFDLYKQTEEFAARNPNAGDTTPLRPTRMTSLHSIRLHQSSGSFSIGTFDTIKDGELRPADGTEIDKKPSNAGELVAKIEKKTDNETREKSIPVESDETESLESEGEESSIRSMSPQPKERSQQKSPLRRPHTVGATRKKQTLIMPSLAKLRIPTSPGSLRGRRTFGRKKKGDGKDGAGKVDKGKAWMTAFGSKNSSKDDTSDIDASKRSTGSARSARRSRRKEDFSEEQSSGALTSIKKAFKNRKARSMSPHGSKGATKKQPRRPKQKKKKKRDS
ncbi:MAG: hypothetical protein SGBAC_004061 [Bacillariaceae sp.]